MNLTPVSELRAQSKHRPTLKELAKKLGCTHGLLSRFENGIDKLSSRLLAKYARAIGANQADVRWAFYVAALEYFNRKAADARARVQERAGLKVVGARKPSTEP